MIYKLVWENVKHKPVRALLSILLIGVPVTLILALVGLSHGIIDDTTSRGRGIGADITLRPKGSSLIQFSDSPIPDKLVDKLETLPHVTQAIGTVNHVVSALTSVTGIDVAAFTKMSGAFDFVEGHSFDGPKQVIVDTYYARQKNVHAGGHIQMLNQDQDWTVVGIVRPGKLSHIFLPIDVLQDLTGGKGKLSQIYLKVDDPKNIPLVIKELNDLLPGYPVYPMEELLSLISIDQVPGLRPFINTIVGISVLIGFAVVSLSMYMAVLQRTREIGILKSLGGSRWFILRLILAEAFVMGLGGTILGIGISFLSRWALLTFVPASLPQSIVVAWWPIVAFIALGASLLGALYPGWLAVRQDPIEALAYE